MDRRTRAYIACGFIGVIFLVVQVGALALVEPFKGAGYQAVENPEDPTNSFVYLGAILVATALMLVAIKLDVDWLIRAFIVFAGGYIAWYVFRIIVPPAVTVGGVNVVAVAAAAVLTLTLWVYPEWYVVDAAGVVMGIGAAALFGISFGLLPALVLLVALAVYDAISVYGTEHMLTLASGVMDLKVPVILVIPLSLSYSFLDADMPDPTDDDADADTNGGDADGPEETAQHDDDADRPDAAAGVDDPDDGDDAAGHGDVDPFDREAMFIGLGDAIIPTVLVASAAFFSPPSVPAVDVPGLALALPALTAMIGTLLGLAVLLRMVLKGRAHAGLPLLNGGAIGGYLVGAVLSGIPLVQAVGLAPYL